jgi:ADP-ribose pyrophosphatase
MRERTIYRGKLVTLVVRQVERGDKVLDREIVEHAPGAAILALDEQGRVLLVRQHRPAVQADVLELPAGLVDAGESPEACALRELQEETGYAAEAVDLLLRFYPSPGFCDEVVHVFAARGVRPSPDHGVDEEEELEVVRLPLDEAIRQVLAGIADAKTMAGLLAFKARDRA